MPLPENFQFSQSSLQDFVDCPRRFELRYLAQLAWPGVTAEPYGEVERAARLGQTFHHLVHQHLAGVPFEPLQAAIHAADLTRWWASYQRLAPSLPGAPSRRYPEVSLSAPLGAYRLVARFDLVVCPAPNQAILYDWKTSQRRPGRAWLAARLQTRLYPYLLVRAGAALNQGQPLAPQGVTLIYWFAEAPDQPERFPYSAAQFQADEAYLTGLIAKIESLAAGAFPLTTDLQRSRYCPFRSLCERGGAAGSLAKAPELTEVDLSEEAADE